MAWTAPRTWVAGETVTASIGNTHWRDNFRAIGDAWTAYTPTWTSTGTAPALGNGSIVGAHVAAGKLIHFRMLLTMGSTTTFGTGSYRFSLPVTALTVTFLSQAVHSTALLLDQGTATHQGIGRLVTTTTIEILSPTATADTRLNNVGQTVPFTWANTDTLSLAGTYEAA